MTVTHRLSWQAWLALLLLAILVWLIISQAAVLLEISFVLMGALLLALWMRPFTDLLYRYHVPRAVTVLLVYAALLLILLLLGDLLAPLLQAEVNQIRQDAPQLWQQAQQQLSGTPLSKIFPSTDALMQELTQQSGALFGSALGTVAGVGRLLLDGLALLILAYFFATDFGWSDRFLRWIPPARRTDMASALGNIEERLTRWVWAQIAISLSLAAP